MVLENVYLVLGLYAAGDAFSSAFKYWGNILNKIAAFLIVTVTLASFILVNFAFTKIATIKIPLFGFIIMLLTFISTQIYIKKVPDAKKREEQIFKFSKGVGLFLLILWVLSFLCLLSIPFLPK